VIVNFRQLQFVLGGHAVHDMVLQAYAEFFMPRVKKYEQEGYWKFLGNLSQLELAAFYPNLDALAVPSLNSTEAFGLVQIEAMMNNVLCVASALPGVRRPVQMHRMGEAVPIGDSAALAQALLEVISGKGKYHCDVAALKQRYSPDSVAAEYEQLFERLR